MRQAEVSPVVVRMVVRIVVVIAPVVVPPCALPAAGLLDIASRSAPLKALSPPAGTGGGVGIRHRAAESALHSQRCSGGASCDEVHGRREDSE